MTTFHVIGLIGIIGLICIMWFLWLAENAPLVDEHENPIEESDMPRQIAVKRYERFQQ